MRKTHGGEDELKLMILSSGSDIAEFVPKLRNTHGQLKRVWVIRNQLKKGNVRVLNEKSHFC